MKLVDELKQLVTKHKQQSKLISELAEQAYQGIVTKCKSSAAEGGIGTNVRIEFEGSCGGNHDIFADIKYAVLKRLNENGVTTKSHPQERDLILVSW